MTKEPTKLAWAIEDAKARFSDRARRARNEDKLTGRHLIDAMQASPWREIDIDPNRASMPVRQIDL